MKQKSVLISVHPSNQVHLEAVRGCIEALEGYETIGDTSSQNGHQITQDDVENKVVVVLLSEAWCKDRQSDLDMALQNGCDFLVVPCQTGLDRPESLTPECRDKLNRGRWLPLFDEAKQMNGQVYDVFEAHLRDLLAKPLVAQKTQVSIAPPSKKQMASAGTWLKRHWKLAAAVMSVLILVLFAGYRFDFKQVLEKFASLFPGLVPPTAVISLPATKTWPTQAGYLAFFSGEGKSWVIGILDLENQVEQFLTEPGRDSSNPDWSCDGSRLAFTSNLNDHYEIYMVDFSTQWLDNPPVPQRVTHDGIDKGYVEWSPDGRQLAYAAHPVGEPQDNNDLEIYVIDMDKPDDPKQVTFNDVQDLALDWSCADPAGLIFESGSSDAQGAVDIYMVDPNNLPLNGRGKNLTLGTGWRARFPSWSCDGTKIAYHASPDSIEDAELFIMNADGSETKQLTDNSYNDFHPAWSPDGTQIVFTSKGRDNNNELYLMDVETGQVLHRLTNQPSVSDRNAVWRFDNC